MMNKLKYFKVDRSRHAKVATVRFFQADLSEAVEFAQKNDPNIFVEDGAYLPSWTKFGADPILAKGFFVTMLQSIFEGKHGIDSLNADHQTRNRNRGPKVSMMFLPASMNNENFGHAANIASESLSGHRVMPIFGEEFGGRKAMTNATSEPQVKEFVAQARKDNKPVLLLSRTMASRSFSIPEITQIFLAYDEGDNGATIQKMSRGLTPDDESKVCDVFSLSFDPNRDDKFDRMIITTAENYARNYNLSMRDALDLVISTIDIFKCSPDRAVKLNNAAFLEQMMKYNRLSRVIGRICQFEGVSAGMIEAFAAADLKALRAEKQKAAKRGKTRLVPLKKNRGEKPKDISAGMIQKARESIVYIAENLDIIIYGTNSKTLDEAFAAMNKNLALEHGIEKRMGISVGLIREAIECGLINKNLLSIMESML